MKTNCKKKKIILSTFYFSKQLEVTHKADGFWIRIPGHLRDCGFREERECNRNVMPWIPPPK